MSQNAPSELVERFLKLAPDTAEVGGGLWHSRCVSPDESKDMSSDKWLPLHAALLNNASSDIIQLLLEAYPEAAEVQHSYG